MLRGRGILGFLAFGFLRSKFLGSLVSKFVGFEVSWCQRLWLFVFFVSKFNRFKIL